jgi:hypothetical protein
MVNRKEKGLVEFTMGSLCEAARPDSGETTSTAASPQLSAVQKSRLLAILARCEASSVAFENQSDTLDSSSVCPGLSVSGNTTTHTLNPSPSTLFTGPSAGAGGRSFEASPSVCVDLTEDGSDDSCVGRANGRGVREISRWRISSEPTQLPLPPPLFSPSEEGGDDGAAGNNRDVFHRPALTMRRLLEPYVSELTGGATVSRSSSSSSSGSGSGSNSSKLFGAKAKAVCVRREKFCLLTIVGAGAAVCLVAYLRLIKKQTLGSQPGNSGGDSSEEENSQKKHMWNARRPAFLLDLDAGECYSTDSMMSPVISSCAQ